MSPPIDTLENILAQIIIAAVRVGIVLAIVIVLILLLKYWLNFSAPVRKKYGDGLPGHLDQNGRFNPSDQVTEPTKDRDNITGIVKHKYPDGLIVVFDCEGNFLDMDLDNPQEESGD